MEEWKDIKGYEGLYQISNRGRVKSLGNNKTRKEKILSLKPGNNGYIRVYLCRKREKTKPFLVHRLVAQAFLPNPDNLPVVNHKDENKLNNNVENLEWCTYQYNNTYGTKIEKARKKRKGKKILCVETNEIFNGSKDVIDKMFNGKGHRSTISACCLGKRKSAFKYHFKYIEE